MGQTVTIAAQPLHITRADEHCLQYLEAHPEEFPYASPVACARRILPLAAEPEIQEEKGIEPDRCLAKDLKIMISFQKMHEQTSKLVSRI